MPRRFFRKFAFKRERIHGQWFMAPFRHLLADHNLWTIRRRTVAPAFSLGIFIAFIPFPGHMLAAVLLALVLRINIPVAAFGTLIVNPLTVGPIYYLCYELGVILLGVEPQILEFEFSIDWVANQFVNIWQPMMLGCTLVGAIVALAGYATVDLLWRASLADYLAKRRARRAESERNL
jgi:hypothetical protein